ncbi:MAG: excinuclease ABC subunit UvrA [Bacteroidales bacterium]|nr:excinuclease ABC subunit UvrA [Bacteroidales bacterium]
MGQKVIEVRGAKVNNLKNIDVDIPRNKLVVITGLSGSGKSSLAFDTLYAEGQRRYVESLSSYARQFMGRMHKPEVQSITGIPPAIAIEQHSMSHNPRSTVGTVTEIYEYLKLLFARIGRTISPVSGKEVRRERVSDVLAYVRNVPEGRRVYVLAPVVLPSGRTLKEQLAILSQQGFSRVVYNRQLHEIDEFLKGRKATRESGMFVLVDRFKSEKIADNIARLTDSIQIAFSEGKGVCVIQTEGENVSQKTFSDLFEADGMSFEEPSVNLFSFNNPYGACKTCSGTGMIEGVDPDLVLPDKTLSVADDAVACWHGDVLSEWKRQFIRQASRLDFPVHRAIEDLSQKEYDLLWYGDEKHHVDGIAQFFQFVAANTFKIQYRVLQARYRGREICPDCHGTRLRKDAHYVKVKGRSIMELTAMPVSELKTFFQEFKYSSDYEREVASRLVKELANRVALLDDVGLGYLTLDRSTSTLSGGEAQRINLATSLGSSLVGSLYVLDEPSIGLHSRDTQNLIRVLQRLRDIGNTVVVVEHDESIIRAADCIIDIGPKAGRNGGEIVFSGVIDDLMKVPDNLTASYLRGMTGGYPQELCRYIPIPKRRRHWRNYVEIIGAKEHNLKNIDVKIPLECFTVITGVSGSGKSSLIANVLYPGLLKMLNKGNLKPGRYSRIDADLTKISDVVFVDQNPIGRSSRSNPVTYVKAYDYIRELFASQPLSKQRNYKPSFFSFNVAGGRCEECEGEGVIRINMQFMADVEMVCPSCNGSRFREEAQDIKLKDKTITDVLNMTVSEALDFFKGLPVNDMTTNIIRKLMPLQDVGLGYLVMGQSSATLSGGEAQRVKLAYYLSLNDDDQNKLFIFDEPTTGLHFHDINKLCVAFNRLIERNNTIVVIEHNAEIIKCADWIIDMGPEGGDQGGKIVFEGTPEKLVERKRSYTAQVISEKLAINSIE